MLLDDLDSLIAKLRASGVRRFRAADGLEIEFEPSQPERSAAGPIDKRALRRQARLRELEEEWAHVGGPPDFVLRQVRDELTREDGDVADA